LLQLQLISASKDVPWIGLDPPASACPGARSVPRSRWSPKCSPTCSATPAA